MWILELQLSNIFSYIGKCLPIHIYGILFTSIIDKWLVKVQQWDSPELFGSYIHLLVQLLNGGRNEVKYEHQKGEYENQ